MGSDGNIINHGCCSKWNRVARGCAFAEAANSTEVSHTVASDLAPRFCLQPGGSLPNCHRIHTIPRVDEIRVRVPAQGGETERQTEAFLRSRSRRMMPPGVAVAVHGVCRMGEAFPARRTRFSLVECLLEWQCRYMQPSPPCIPMPPLRLPPPENRTRAFISSPYRSDFPSMLASLILTVPACR